MTLTDREVLLADADRGLNLLRTGEGEVICRIQSFCPSALKCERQSSEESSNRTGVKTVADTLQLFIRKPPRDVFFSVRTLYYIDRLLFLLQRLHDFLQIIFAISEKRPDHVFARWADSHAVGRLIIGAE